MEAAVKNSQPEKVRFLDLGLSTYKLTWDIQEGCFREVTDIKLNGRETVHYLLFCEHPHVYTLGKSGSENNLLIDYIQLQAKDAEFYRINRGGDITYHGPGQIVGYPILDLERFGLNARSYIYLLEESIIRVLKKFGLEGDRLEGATGVWLDPGSRPRKICAIGVRLSRFVSMHGFAFNVNTDLQYFSYINPCGYIDKGVTSLAKELGCEMDVMEVKSFLKQEIGRLFKMNFVPWEK